MMNKLYNILFLSLLVLANCSRDNSIDPNTYFVSEYEFITLHQICQNCPLPVIVLPKKNNLFFGNNTKQSYALAFNKQTSSKDFFLKKGTGCAIIETGMQNTFIFEIENITERKTINFITLPEKHVSGQLNGFTEWKSDTCYIVDSDLTIQASDE